MKKVRLLLFCGILVFTYSCSGGHKHFYKSPLVQKDLSVQKVDHFTIHNTAKTDYTIGKLRFSFAINNNDSLFAFYDEIKRRFVVVNNQGAILHLIGHEGRGPEELIKVQSYNFNPQNQLVAFDQSQVSLKVFSLNGQILSQAKLKESLFPIIGRKLYILDHRIYGATVNAQKLGGLSSRPGNKVWKSKLAAAYNYKGILVDTVGTYDPTVRNTKDYNVFSIINIDNKTNWLLSTQWNNYRIQVFDLKTGKRLAWFGRKTAHFHEGKKYIAQNLPKQKIEDMGVGRSTAWRVYMLNNYVILYFETLTKAFFDTNDFNKKKPYIALYNKKTHGCYGDIKLPYILGSVAGNKLYLIENSNPDHFTVGVYEITEGN